MQEVLWMPACLRQPVLRRVLCMLLAIPAVFACTYMLRINQDFTLLNHSLIGVLLWWACFKALFAAAQMADRRLLWVCLPLGLVFSGMMVCGSLVVQYRTARLFELKTWVGIACGTPLFAALSMLFVKGPARKVRFGWMEERLQKLNERQFFLLCWGLVFLAWLPGLVASYPGVYGYDSIYQIDAYLKGALSTHHPILHTGWLGFCIVTLGTKLGSYEAGMCVYALMQMLVFSASVSSLLGYMRRRNAGHLLLLGSLLVFQFLPAYAILSFSATKDIVFSAFVVWTLLWLLEAARDAARLKGIRPWLTLLGLGIGLMLSRNQGLYVFLFALLAGVLLWKGQRLRLICVAAAGVLCFGLFQGPISNALHADRVETVQEALSVPIVQLSCAMMTQPVNEADAALAARYIPDYRNYDYTTCGIADPVKNTFDAALFRQSPSAFFRLWARVGAEHPEAYLNAFLRLTAGWWYPDMTYRDWAAHHPYYEYHNTDMDGWVCLKRTTPKGFGWLARLYEAAAVDGVGQKIPVLSMLSSCSLAAWGMLLFIAWAIYAKKQRMLVPAALLFGLWGTLLLGPVVLLRYGLPLVMAQGALMAAMGDEKG